MRGVKQSELAGTKADKDCRACNRRRIRCDRKVPFCSKCSKKGLVCPGYKQALRWTNAIAVRGRFRGLAAPDIQQAATLYDEVTELADSPPLAANYVSETDVQATLARFTAPVVKFLLHHYETEISPIMTWLDSPQNGYRLLLLPLAESQPILKLAILATAARHAPFDTGVDENLLRSASETAVMTITLRLTQLTEQNPNNTIQYDVDPTGMQAIIAAVLVLSDYSLLRSNLYVAQFHREGIRTLFKTLKFTTRGDNELFDFLEHEAAAYDVLACTTIFEVDRVRDAVLPSTQNTIFARFLRVIHGITICSLDQHSGNGGTDADEIGDDDQLKDYSRSTTELENDFEVARGSTLLSASPHLATASETLKHDFVCLVAAYHHAGLLYAHKRLPCINMERSTRDQHIARLFHVLELIQEIRVIISSLTWPFFIAGICCGGDTVRMAKVDEWCQLLIKETRYEHYDLLATFLRELHRSSQHNWITLARQYENQCRPIVAI